jgi:hypothetical protein
MWGQIVAKFLLRRFLIAQSGGMLPAAAVPAKIN